MNIIAEIAQSYEGSFDVLSKIIDSLGETQVDMVMFQVVFVEELATPENSNYSFFNKLRFNDGQLSDLVQRIKRTGKRAVAEVFGEKSATKMVEFGADALKIHPADVSNIPFLTAVSALGVPIYMGVGGCFDSEIQQAVEILKKNSKLDITLMHGFQACPTPLQDSHFAKIKELKKFGVPVGYSDHSPGCVDGNVQISSAMGLYSSSTALAFGAATIEKHVILDRSKAWEDYESALTPKELDIAIDYLRHSAMSIGDVSTDFNKIEAGYRRTSKKYLVAKRAIKKGDAFTMDMLTVKRIGDPSVGLINFSDAVGKIAKHDFSIDEAVTKEGLV